MRRIKYNFKPVLTRDSLIKILNTLEYKQTVEPKLVAISSHFETHHIEPDIYHWFRSSSTSECILVGQKYFFVNRLGERICPLINTLTADSLNKLLIQEGIIYEKN